MNDPPHWYRQWLARSGDAFMTYEQYAAPRRKRACKPKPEFVRIRKAICRQCLTADPSRHCAGARPCYRRRPLAACPDDPPRWGPAG